ncbi:hypothetical protein PTI98_012329 [Pleurotus ostreatus]|nr:hypothetical protein PTI98_012329 [Pleurotus ostreatus]
MRPRKKRRVVVDGKSHAPTCKRTTWHFKPLPLQRDEQADPSAQWTTDIPLAIHISFRRRSTRLGHGRSPQGYSDFLRCAIRGM